MSAQDLLFEPAGSSHSSPKPRSRQTEGSRRASESTVPPSSLIDSTSNNPFRRRHVSQTYALTGTSSKPPPLPPRKPSQAPSLPPRQTHSISSSLSIDSYAPTSTSTPSNLIRNSLIAADRAKESSSDPTIHVIKHSDLRHTSTATALHDKIAEAVRLSEPFEDIAEPYQKEEPDIRLWSCIDILSSSETPRYAMIILNQPIQDKKVFIQAWRSSSLHLCADGGANRLYDLWDPNTRLQYLPSMIKGDLDSIRPEVKAYYKSQGVRVGRDPDQYSTDLMKCIKQVEKEEKTNQIKYPLLLIGGLSGRIDQTVHTMSLLHKLRSRRPQSYVLSSESLAWVLDKGSHLIEIDHDTMGETCGILPVGVEKAMVKTKGLKWNLDWETSLDGEVSTSNHLLPSEPVVYIQTSHPILWCIEVKNAK